MVHARDGGRRVKAAKPGLSVYRAKRDFSKTDEPRGQLTVAASPRSRFVVQKHAARRLHYDLRLEMDGVFKSWAVTRGPSLDPADKRLAVEVEDHPLDYGDFEGTIPKGEYGGGTVQLWDRGYWSPEGQPPADGLKGGDLKFTLYGARLHGSWVLVRIRGDRSGGKHTPWLLIKHRDSYAKPGDADSLLAQDTSVASGRTLEQIAEGVGPEPTPFMRSVGSERPGRQGPSAQQGRSGRSGRAAARIPAFVEPQLCKLVDRPPAEPGWGHEVKLDGYRAQVSVRKHRVTIRTRTGLDWTSRFAAIAGDAQSLPDCLIDGEVVALDARRLPSFAALQAALAADRSDELVFFAFDLLFDAREDLRTLPLIERKARLQELLGGHVEGFRLRYTAHLVSNAADIFASAQNLELEGIVSKRLDAPYRSGRTGSWTKAKVRAGQEVVIGGWTAEGRTVRSLLAGVYRGADLRYVGRVGTGFGRAVAAALSPRLEKLARKSSPFGGDDAPPDEPKVRWVNPKLVAEIEFAGWTATGMLRQAAFKAIREDKPAREVVAETPAPGAAAETLAPSAAAETAAPEPAAKHGPRHTRVKAKAGHASHASGATSADAGHASHTRRMVRTATPGGPIAVLGVTISKPDKALWPDAGDGTAVTKLDLARYYERVGEWLLPHLVGRPCSLLRVPDGFGSEQFFQRHAMAGMSTFLSSVKVRGDKAPYVQIDRVEGLAAVAQIGALEIHPWNGAPGNPEVAGRLVFDLDPAPDVAFDAVIIGALEIRDRLKAVGLESFCKTTGGKGLHVVTPLLGGKDAVEWPVAKNFAHIICAQMSADSPDKYLDTMPKNKRTGKIFLDYLRNDRTATAVAVLSPRAREGAPVSMPIHWKQVAKGLNPKAYTVRSAPGALLEAKPWGGYEQGARSLSKAIALVTRRATPTRRSVPRRHHSGP